LFTIRKRVNEDGSLTYITSGTLKATDGRCRVYIDPDTHELVTEGIPEDQLEIIEES
jgi:hypothetical protein